MIEEDLRAISDFELKAPDPKLDKDEVVEREED